MPNWVQLIKLKNIGEFSKINIWRLLICLPLLYYWRGKYVPRHLIPLGPVREISHRYWIICQVRYWIICHSLTSFCIRSNQLDGSLVQSMKEAHWAGVLWLCLQGAQLNVDIINAMCSILGWETWETTPLCADRQCI